MSQVKGDKSWKLPTDAAGRTIMKNTPNRPNATQSPDQTVSALKKGPAPVPQFRCRFHMGEVVGKYWTCCKQHVSADPCGGALTHNLREEHPADLAKRYQFHSTPTQPSHPHEIRVAVALDCEMGTAVSGDTELIRVTLIDYFSGDILVNHLVEPTVPMKHLNTRFSGVTFKQIREAKRRGVCLKGAHAARRAMWTYVGPKTVVVGHGLQNDLRALKWIHGVTVDSFVIEWNIKKARDDAERQAKEEAEKLAKEKAEAEGVVLVEGVAKNDEADSVPAAVDGKEGAVPGQKKKRTRTSRGDLSLKTLAEKRLKRKIQLGEGTTGHDSLEDAITARDVVHWHVTNPSAKDDLTREDGLLSELERLVVD
ncbi:hypothetical protein N0V90_008722 [Kalmusia sp. IMI 367209]|nr:hypothetical protein N0V90_008722 [Kalmusia sp. IMI 367209]